MDRLCPDCGSPLSVAPGTGARTLTCPSCQGRLYGLAPFERLLTDGVGARVWTGSESGSAAGPCPCCSRPMHHADADDEAHSALAVCRMCQEVWVPASTADWMAAHSTGGGTGAASASAAAPPPADCVNCGAPFQPDDDGKCHWCHTQIGAPEPAVVFVETPQPASSGFRLF